MRKAFDCQRRFDSQAVLDVRLNLNLYKRGKAATPVQFGRQVLVYEDGAGFISHAYLMPRDADGRDVVVEQTRIVQRRLMPGRQRVEALPRPDGTRFFAIHSACDVGSQSSRAGQDPDCRRRRHLPSGAIAAQEDGRLSTRRRFTSRFRVSAVRSLAPSAQRGCSLRWTTPTTPSTELD